MAKPKKHKRCDACGQRRPDVRKMHDPFVEALDPDGEQWERKLCEPCAIARHEES